MDFYGQENVDFKALLELLKADDDPMSVHQHVETLRQTISIADERKLQDFPTGGYITRLIEVLGHTIMMDFQVDTKHAIMITFCTLMDTFPNTIGQMVQEGLITTICNVIQENMQYIDLANEAAKMCIKMSHEKPVEVLDSAAIPTLMQVFDFCDNHVQSKIIDLCHNVSRHCSSDEQYNQKLMPILQWIYPKIEVSKFASNQKQSEKIASIISNMINAMYNFYSPSKNFDKFASKYENMINIGLIDRITACIGEYSAIVASTRASGQAQAAGADVEMDGAENSLINTNAQGGNQSAGALETTYTEQTISVILSILGQGSKFSNLLVANILQGQTLHILTQLLPDEDMDQPAYLNELTALLNQLLPQSESEQQKAQKYIVFGPRQVYQYNADASSQYQLLKKQIETLEVQKRELYASMSQDFFEFCASTLLTKLFILYGEIIGHTSRERCITIIDKILAMLPSEVAHDKIDPSSLAELVLQILATGTGQQVLIALQISHRVLESNPMKFVIPFQRRGTSQAIIDLSNAPDSRVQKYDTQAEEMAALEEMQNKAPACRCCQPKLSDTEARLAQLGRGLFAGGGGKQSEDETIEIITVECEKIRAIMQMSESSMSQAKKDMLGIALKEKEIQLAMLKEKRLAKQEAERAKKAEEEKAASEEAKKEGGAAATESATSEAAKKVEPSKISVLVKEQSTRIVEDFVQNEVFLKQVSDANGEEIQLAAKFKELAGEILDEACSSTFNCQKTQSLMEKLTGCLTQAHGMTTFEFAQSGILHALEIFLTKAPSMALIEREQLRNQDQNEEMKRSEEIMLQAAQKQAKQQISQKEARCLLLRIKVAANLLCIEKNAGKFPLKELISQCHDIVSSNEKILFDESTLTSQTRTYLDASEAIRNLHRREMIKIVYDPDGSLMEKAQRKALGLPEDDFEASESAKEKEIESMAQPALGNKAKSAFLPFGHLGGGGSAAANEAAGTSGADQVMLDVEERSQVFQKRDRCFSVLSQVQLDVMHAENLWMVEERLKKVDTLTKAKDYGQLQMERNALRGVVKTAEEAEELAERFNNMADEETQDLLDRISSRLDEMLDEAHSQEQFEVMKPSFIEEYTEEICEIAIAADMSDNNLQLFFDMLHLEMEDKIQEHEMGVAENEDANMDFLRPEHIKTLMLVKIKAFGNMIRETKERTYELFKVKKLSQEAIEKAENAADKRPDEEMQEEVKKEQQEGSAAAQEESKDQPKPQTESAAATTEQKEEQPKAQVASAGSEEPAGASQAQTRIEFAQPPQIQAQLSADTDQAIEDPGASKTVTAVVDVEMTDEQQESSQPAGLEKEKLSINEESLKANKRKSRKYSGLQDEVKDKTLIDAMDLNQLIQKNNGVDVDLEFYFKGKLMPQNTCFYEVIQQAQKDRKKELVKPQEMPKLDKSNPASLFKHLMASMHRGEQINEAEKITIYFRCVDRKSSQQQARKNSLLDFTNRRERTRSQAADLASVHSLNQVVQGLIGNEFSVFQHSVDDEVRFVDYAEKNQIECALKILKVLYFITTNTYLLSEEGLNFLLGRSETGSDFDHLQSRGMDLTVPLENHGKKDMFYHYKLDANVLKLIQDPHKLVTGGLSGFLKEIFNSCSFLFHYETKLLYFKLVSFMGVDINKCLEYLRNYQKKRAVGQQIYIPDQREERKGQGNKNETMQKEQVSREAIFQEAMQIMDRIEKRKQLNIYFEGEEGFGLGPTYEFFALLATHIQGGDNQSYWIVCEPDSVLFPAPIDAKSLTQEKLKQVSDLFRLAGTFVAKSIVDNKLIDLPISRLMWDLLLDKKLNMLDFQEYQKFQFNHLRDLQQLANRKKEIDDMSCDIETKNRLLQGVKTSQGQTIDQVYTFFTLPQPYENIELVKDGANIQVTLDNVQEYIDLVLHCTFNECVILQIQAFKKGFNSIMPLDSIRSFSTKGEIEDMICGEMMDEQEWKDLGKLKQGIKPDHGYNSESRAYNDFLRFIIEMEKSFRPKFIQWLTGSKRLPRGGFASLENHVSINRANSKVADLSLPSVNTCLHYIKVPEYSSYEVMKIKFEQAVLFGSGHFALS